MLDWLVSGISAVGSFFGSLFGGSDNSSSGTSLLPFGALNQTFNDMARLGISQGELEIHYQQLEMQRQTLGVNRQNALDRIAADFQLEQIREERESRRQKFDLNKLKLQFLNQYQMQQNEHEFQLARDISNFERSVQLAQLNAENAKKLEEFRQSCENLRLQKSGWNLKFSCLRNARNLSGKIQEYGRETQIIVANINRKALKNP
ncbi:MAG: hypothetical protein R3E08_15045 [Thiotrichaceae bacterium]